MRFLTEAASSSIRLAQESGASMDGMSYTEALRTLRHSFDEIRTSNNTIQKNYMEQRNYLQRSFLLR